MDPLWPICRSRDDTRAETIKPWVSILVQTYKGSCTGVITRKSFGGGGFGYDPVFYYPPLKATFAEIAREDKNRVSHRGKALRALKADFKDVLKWLTHTCI